MNECKACCEYCGEAIEEEESVYDLRELGLGFVHEDCGLDWLGDWRCVYTAPDNGEIRG